MSQTTTLSGITDVVAKFKEQFPEFPYWLQIQKGHDKVVRWGSYIKVHPHFRKQTNSNHVVSVINIATSLCYRLKKHNSFDYGMVLGAFNIHEDGEALLEKDTRYNEKKIDASDDVKEYDAFYQHHLQMLNADYELFCELEKLFLLQFVTKEHKWDQFSVRAQGILLKLKKTSLREAQIFDAIERYEYLYYCLEDKHRLESLLPEVLANQIEYLNHYAYVILGFDTIWTPKKRFYAETIIALHMKNRD